MTATCPLCGSAVEREGALCPRCSTEHPTESQVAASGMQTKAATPQSLVPGVLLAGRYRILARLGSGAMGEVYRAEDESLDQIVAL